MAEVGSWNNVGYLNLASFDYIDQSKIASIDGVTFPYSVVADISTIYVIGTTTTKPRISTNYGASFADISTGTLATSRSATGHQNGTYQYTITTDRKNIIVNGYSGTTSHVSRSHDGGSTWDVSMYSSVIFDFQGMSRDASYAYVGEWTYPTYLRSTNRGYSFTSSGGFGGSLGPLNFAVSNDGRYVYTGTPNISSAPYSSSDYGVTFAAAGTTTGQHKLVSCDGSGQYVWAWYTGTHGAWLSTNYGVSFSRISNASGACYAGMFNDMSLLFYGQVTSGDASAGLWVSTNQGGSWTRITWPSGWAAATTNVSWSAEKKRVFISQSTANKSVYKLNDTYSGWDLLTTMDVNVYGVPGTSEYRDEIAVADASYNVYNVNASTGARTFIYSHGAPVIPSIF